jgi:hypothetical protein
MSEHDAARRLLRELLEEVVGTNGNGHRDSVPAAPQVPAPPVAAVLRPSTWDRPAAPGEVIGDESPDSPADSPAPDSPGAPAPDSPHPPAPGSAGGARTEWVVLDTDADLDRFVRGLVARFENPRDRMAIRAGTLRFALRRTEAAAATGPVHRVERGAVTERVVAAAADAGARLVLAPAAVLTPLAREKARALRVEIEREKRC